MQGIAIMLQTVIIQFRLVSFFDNQSYFICSKMKKPPDKYRWFLLIFMMNFFDATTCLLFSSFGHSHLIRQNCLRVVLFSKVLYFWLQPY